MPRGMVPGAKNVAGRSARHFRKALDAARSAINADSQPRYASNTWENNSNKRPCRMLSLLPSDRGRRCRCLFEGPGVADATWYGAGRKKRSRSVSAALPQGAGCSTLRYQRR
ncbi:hypothetical protein MRX96_008103 [Rhipicephalus microplus]